MTEIQWEDPPGVAKTGARRPDPVLSAFAAALRSHPNRWARYPRPLSGKDSASTTARNIKRAFNETWQPADSFDATVRTVDGEVRLYVRYVGGQS